MSNPLWHALDIGDSVHVYPLADTLEHTLTADCVCGPTVEQWERPLITHASLDGRELIYG